MGYEIKILEHIVYFLLATSCAQLYESGVRENAEYTIDPQDGKGPFNVLCDMTGGGGWTVIQKRFNGSINFNRHWTDYKNGFGNFGSEFWLGLNEIHRLTSTESNTLKIVLESFDNEYRHATYSPFKVGDEGDSFNLTAKNYAGEYEVFSSFSLTFHEQLRKVPHVSKYFVN